MLSEIVRAVMKIKGAVSQANRVGKRRYPAREKFSGNFSPVP
jgi:hypothetical protein